MNVIGAETTRGAARGGATILAMALFVAACGTATPALDPSTVEGQPPLNPILDDGRLVYRSFGDHHPTCFAFVEGTRDTEDVPCPDGAIDDLAACPGGKLVRQRETGCACIPEDDAPPFAVDCPG